MKQYRCFFAHSKAEEDEDINDMVESCEVSLQALKPDSDVKIIPGRDCFAERGRMLSWTGWIRDVAYGKLTDGSPRYHAIIVPSLTIGKATYEICKQALAERKPVVLWHGNRFTRVTGLTTLDPKDYQTGWKCEIAA